ncbi:hypothetical protein ACFLXY_04415 [Chloroflexota bacterium]
MDLIRRNYKLILIIILFLNVAGIFLMFFTPFGGMTVSTAYGPRDRFASLGSDYSEVLDNVFIILIVIMLGITTFYTGRLTRMVLSASRQMIKLSLIFSICLVLITIIGAVVFNILRGQIDYMDWWMDTGFYAAIIIGLVDSAFYAVMIRSAE